MQLLIGYECIESPMQVLTSTEVGKGHCVALHLNLSVVTTTYGDIRDCTPGFSKSFF